MVVISFVAPPASTVVVVARAVVADVVDTLNSSSGFDGVPGVAVGPETTLDRRCRGSDSLPAPLVLGRRWIQAVGGWRSSPLALRVLARGGALCLLCRRNFEQRLQLLAHSSLLRGRGLREAARQHGHRGKVLRHPMEKWRSVSVGVRVDIHACIGASIVVGLWPTCRRCRCAVVWLVYSRATLVPVDIPLTGLPLHRNVLCRLLITGLGIHAELLA
jgi:hypothetical protein